ncbi:A/G-specific DNA glycosylase [Methylacidiphilum fumariolicum SolV]|uniref:Adenine DNA glycosylase n=5 Tax=Candidatus Methylacidiphilum fumarolicum TaxID=591154 RepID=I0JY79_METFB|nr:A/G-specific adenine glycosylase [Candidatus Methylacidiphilum fumarolicum]CCG92198.1 A/G-specific DNA glycosylase [Methylacidiphilum fumariolicum SolV]
MNVKEEGVMENGNNIAFWLERIDAKFRESFPRRLFEWYEANAYSYPWRQAKDPYAIVVSEFMLQQTQAKTVIAYYLKWMERFGDWEKLANASEGEVLKAWEGLGYYARARNLHKIAAIVFFEKKGILPSEPTELLKLPGIGLYTANAIASLAFGKKTVALDANGIRVLVRLLSIHQPINKAGALKELSRIAMNLLSEDNDFSLFNSALMDFGRAVCKPLAPKCMICPLKEICQAEQPELLPFKPKKRIEVRKEKIAILRKEDSIWLHQANSKTGRYQGMWLFPNFDPFAMEQKTILFSLPAYLSRYKIFLEVCEADWKQEKLVQPNLSQGEWIKKEKISFLPLPAPHRKIWMKLMVEQAFSPHPD